MSVADFEILIDFYGSCSEPYGPPLKNLLRVLMQSHKCSTTADSWASWCESDDNDVPFDKTTKGGLRLADFQKNAMVDGIINVLCKLTMHKRKKAIGHAGAGGIWQEPLRRHFLSLRKERRNVSATLRSCSFKENVPFEKSRRGEHKQAHTVSLKSFWGRFTLFVIWCFLPVP